MWLLTLVSLLFHLVCVPQAVHSAVQLLLRGLLLSGGGLSLRLKIDKG